MVVMEKKCRGDYVKLCVRFVAKITTIVLEHHYIY